MKRLKVLLILILVLIAGLVTTGLVSATPSANFHEINNDIFDDWGVCRTRGFGEDGFYQVSETTFRPVIAFESLGDEAALAYSFGKQFADKYPDKLQRAKAIFSFVQDRVAYATDIDLFKKEEFAQNADELADAIDKNGVTYGDCEDSAILLAVMWKGAGLRSAIAIGTEHTAAMVYLPDYKKANVIFKIEDEPGWVWAEATGKNNPLGWAPSEFINTSLGAYEINAEEITTERPTTEPSVAIATGGRTGSSQPFPFIGIIGILWIISFFRRRHTRQPS